MDQYFVVKLLGQGAEGHVLQCENKNTGEQLAIKRLEISNMEKANQSLNEAYKLLILTSKKNSEENYLVEYKRVFLHRYPAAHTMYICLVMEYCEAGDLANFINKCWAHSNKKTPVKEKQVLQFMLQICNGVNHLHENGLIHRDLKPSNVLLAKNNVLKIADFGTVKQLQRDESYKAYTLCGTADFIANEVLMHQPYNEKLDMYSVGMILMNMLTGKTCMLSQQWKHNHNAPVSEYDDPNGGLYDYFAQLKVKICEQHGYSESVYALMRQLLSFNPNERPSALECTSILKQMLTVESPVDRSHLHSFSSLMPLTSLDLFQLNVTSDVIRKRVITYLDFSDIYCTMQVSRAWYHLCQSEDLWQLLCERMLGTPVVHTKVEPAPPTKKKKLRFGKNQVIDHPSKPTSSIAYYKSHLRNYFNYRKQALAKRKKSTLGKKLVHEVLPDQLEQAAVVLASSYHRDGLFRYALQLDGNIFTPLSGAKIEEQIKNSLSVGEKAIQSDTALQSGNNSSILKEMNEQLTTRVKEETFLSFFTRSRDQIMAPLTQDQHEALLIIMRELVRLAVNQGRIWVLTNHDLYNQSAVQAVAVWQNPKLDAISLWKQVRKNCQSLKLRAQLIQKVGLKVSQRLLNVLRMMHKVYKYNWKAINEQGTRNNLWYLYSVGVVPEARNNGFGSLVLQPVLRTANESGLPCYTTCVNDKNVSFFLRHGFTLLDQPFHHNELKISYFSLKRSDDIYVNYN